MSIRTLLLTLAVAVFVSMVASKDTADAEKVEERGQVEDKAEHKAEVEKGQLQDGEALMEEAEEEESDQEEEGMDEEDEEEDMDEEDEEEDMEDGEEEGPEDPAQVMQEMDTDKDGLLDLAELVGAEEQANLNQQNGLSIKEVFEVFDKNKDGKLDMQE